MKFAEAIQKCINNNIIYTVKNIIKINNTINHNSKSVIFYNIKNINEKNLMNHNKLEINNINKILQIINI